MPQVTESAKLDWEEKPTPREGRIQRKSLAKGQEGDPNNFEFNLYRFFPGYLTPRHRHNWEQFRFGLPGSQISYEPGKIVSENSLVYFPEGAYYGPQGTDTVSDIVLLQYGGASGAGYLSQEQLMVARAEMIKEGTFKDGVYTWHTPDGTKHNQDAAEAVWERVFQTKVQYIKPRIPESVKLETEAYKWVPTETVGLDEKALAMFTERKTAAAMYRATAPTRLKLTSGRRHLLFTLKGECEVQGNSCGAYTSIFFDENETVDLALKPGFETLAITLPDLRSHGH
jgi:hypothetical protein